jgi:hypothetical protein
LSVTPYQTPRYKCHLESCVSKKPIAPVDSISYACCQVSVHPVQNRPEFLLELKSVCIDSSLPREQTLNQAELSTRYKPYINWLYFT